MSRGGEAATDAPGKVRRGTGWITYAEHIKAMRLADERFDAERDRRYAEVDIEKEKALKIKETADRDALSLARDAQTYKDQQADIMRDKTLADSGIYATNASVAAAIGTLRDDLQPLVDYVSGQKGATVNAARISGRIYAIGAIIATLFGGGMIVLLVKLFGG